MAPLHAHGDPSEGEPRDAPLPKAVTDMMATREHRLHHWLWHEVRLNWRQYPRDVQLKLEELGWKPPRPVLDDRGLPDLTNDSGEDFLYMHRQMIGDVNAVLATAADPSYPRVQGWLMPPPPEHPDYPVPPPWFDPEGQAPNALPLDRLQWIKSDMFYEKRFKFWQRLFTDPAFLRGLGLGSLGIMIEWTIHAAMHLRWAANPASSRPDPEPTAPETIAPEWDDPRYEFLADTYSSHVNPIFWRLHGWIDDRIEDWKLANGIFGSDFWKATWIGKMPGHEPTVQAHGALEHPQAVAPHLSGMEQAATVVAGAGAAQRPFVHAASIGTW
jgi:hypothetical protein